MNFKITRIALLASLCIGLYSCSTGTKGVRSVASDSDVVLVEKSGEFILQPQSILNMDGIEEFAKIFAVTRALGGRADFAVTSDSDVKCSNSTVSLNSWYIGPTCSNYTQQEKRVSYKLHISYPRKNLEQTIEDLDRFIIGFSSDKRAEYMNALALLAAVNDLDGEKSISKLANSVKSLTASVDLTRQQPAFRFVLSPGDVMFISSTKSELTISERRAFFLKRNVWTNVGNRTQNNPAVGLDVPKYGKAVYSLKCEEQNPSRTQTFTINPQGYTVIEAQERAPTTIICNAVQPQSGKFRRSTKISANMKLNYSVINKQSLASEMSAKKIQIIDSAEKAVKSYVTQTMAPFVAKLDRLEKEHLKVAYEAARVPFALKKSYDAGKFIGEVKLTPVVSTEDSGREVRRYVDYNINVKLTEQSQYGDFVLQNYNWQNNLIRTNRMLQEGEADPSEIVKMTSSTGLVKFINGLEQIQPEYIAGKVVNYDKLLSLVQSLDPNATQGGTFELNRLAVGLCYSSKEGDYKLTESFAFYAPAGYYGNVGASFGVDGESAYPLSYSKLKQFPQYVEFGKVDHTQTAAIEAGTLKYVKQTLSSIPTEQFCVLTQAQDVGRVSLR